MAEVRVTAAYRSKKDSTPRSPGQGLTGRVLLSLGDETAGTGPPSVNGACLNRSPRRRVDRAWEGCGGSRSHRWTTPWPSRCRHWRSAAPQERRSYRDDASHAPDGRERLDDHRRPSAEGASWGSGGIDGRTGARLRRLRPRAHAPRRAHRGDRSARRRDLRPRPGHVANGDAAAGPLPQRHPRLDRRVGLPPRPAGAALPVRPGRRPLDAAGSPPRPPRRRPPLDLDGRFAPRLRRRRQPAPHDRGHLRHRP
jgi:hypothetical protein